MPYGLVNQSIDPPVRHYDWVVGEELFALPALVEDGTLYVHDYIQPYYGSRGSPGLYADYNTVSIRILRD